LKFERKFLHVASRKGYYIITFVHKTNQKHQHVKVDYQQHLKCVAYKLATLEKCSLKDR